MDIRYSAVGEPYPVETADLIPAKPTATSIPRLKDPSKIVPAAPNVEPITQSIGSRESMDAKITNYLSTVSDPRSEEAKIKVTRFLAYKTNTDFATLYDNYDEMVPSILGFTLGPKSDDKFIMEQFQASNIDTEIWKLNNRILNTPGQDHTYEEAEIKRLEESKPPVDPYKHSLAIDMLRAGASMIPYMWAVGKSAIPAMVVGAVAGAVSGGAGTATTVAQVTKTLSTLVNLWSKAESFRQGYMLTTGSLYGELRGMKDDEGNSIDDGVARKVTMIAGLPIAGLEAIGGQYFFTGNSVFKSIASRLGDKLFKEKLEQAAAKTVTALTIKGFFHDQAKKMAKRTGEMLVHEILLEEVPQELMTIQATEMAKHFTNDLTGAEFEDITGAEVKDRTMQTIIESFKGMMVLGLGRSSLNTVKDFNTYAQSRQADYKAKESAKKMTGRDMMVDTYADTDNEAELEMIEKGWEADQAMAEKPTTTITDDKIVVKNGSQETIGHAEYVVEDDVVTINKMETKDVSASIKIQEDLMNEFPDKRVYFSSTVTDPNARLLEDDDLEISRQNIKIAKEKSIIQSSNLMIEHYSNLLEEANTELESEIDEDKKAEIEARIQGLEQSIAEEHETIAVAEEVINRTDEMKKNLTKPAKQPHTMTADEYKNIIQFPREQLGKFVETEKGQELLEKLDITNMSMEEKKASLGILEMMANAKGVNTESLIEDYFQEGVVTKQKSGETRASVEFDNDMKALLKLSEESNFKSWVHEVGHVMLKHLSESDLKVAEKWVEDVSGFKTKNGKWTADMEEVFAEGFVKFINDGKVESKGMKDIFIKLAKLLRSVFEAVKLMPELSDEIRIVFENQLSSERIGALEEDQKIEMFETEYESLIKEAVKDESKVVPLEVLQQFDTDWAKEEIAKQEKKKQILSEMGEFAEMARNSNTVEEFIEELDMYMGEDTEKLQGKDRAWAEEFYNLAKQDTITDINTGNKEWANRVSEDYVKALVMGVSKDVSGADAAGMPTTIVAAARRYLSKKDFRPKSLSIIEKTLKNDPSGLRSIASEYIGDFEEMRRVEMEKQFSEEIAVEEDVPIKKMRAERMDIAEEMSNVADKEMIQRGTITSKKAEKLMKKGSEEINNVREAIAKTKQEMKALEEAHGQKLDVMIASRNKELKAQAQKLKDALKEQKAELKAKEKARKEAKKAKDYMRKLGKQITKKVALTIDANYRKAIEMLQQQVDPNFRRQSTIDERAVLRDMYEQNPELEKLISKKKMAKLNSKPLNLWTANELEALKEQIDMLKYQGKHIKKIRDMERKRLIEKDVTNATEQVLKNGELDVSTIATGEGKTTKQKITEAYLKTVRVNRILDMIDGGKGFKSEEYNGVVYRIVWDGISESYNQEINEKHRRQTGLMNKMKSLGMNRYALDRKIKYKDTTLSADAVLDIWAGWQNEKKRAILEENHRITPEIYKELTSQLTDKEIELGQYIMDDYAESFERLREAFYLDKNIILEAEENYTPIRVIMDGLTADEMDIYKEMMGRNQIRPSLQKGMTKKRVSHDHEIQLGILSTWHGAVVKEEHYINNVAKLKHINAVLSDRTFNKAVKSVGKDLQLKEVKDWLRRYANPLANKSNKGWDRAIRVLKQNAAVAYLWGNIMTMAKQIPSIAYFMAYSGPDFFTGLFSNYNESRALMDKWSPELTKGRSFEAFVDSVKKQSSSKGLDYIRQMGAMGLKGIEFFDRQVITAGWRGVYEHGRRHGLSNQEAARKATQAVLLTQPASGIKDTAALYADDNMLSMFLMFTNQLNQIFLSLTYDAPQAIMNKKIAKGITIYMSSAIGALALWMISNRRIPDDDDMVDVFTDQFFSVIPGLGKIMGGYVDGYDLSLPALAPVVGVASGLEVTKMLLEGKKPTEKQLEMALNTMYEGFAIGVGLPYTEVNRLYKGFKNDAALEYLIFGGKLNDK